MALAADEIDRVLGILLRKGIHLRGGEILDRDRAVLPVLEREIVEGARLGVVAPHVVRVHQTARLVETARRRPGVGLVADVPLAENRGGIAARLEHLRDGRPAGVHAAGARAVRADQPGAFGIAAGQQRPARGGTDRLRHMQVHEAAALGGEPPHVWRVIGGRAERMEIGVARVVEEDHDDVGRA